MSDSALHLVDVDATAKDAAAVGKKAIAWLAECGVVGKKYKEESFHSDDPWSTPAKAIKIDVWPPGPKVMDVVQKPPAKKRGQYMSFLEITPNYVELSVARRFFVSDDAVFSCSACNEELDLFSQVGPLLKGKKSKVRCGACKHSMQPNDVGCDGAFAFAELAVTFWNWWPLLPSLEKALGAALGHRLIRFHERI